MSAKVKAQLAAIKREAARIELEKMRAHVKAKKRKLAGLEADERNWTKARKLERKSRLKDLRKSLRDLQQANAKARTAKVRAIAERRKQFEEWWAGVRRERDMRLAEIKRMRADLRAWSKDLPNRRRAAVAEIAAAAQRHLESFDQKTASELDALERAIQEARRELKSDEYDLKTWASNRRRESRTIAKPPKRARGESTAELVSNIEANLETAEEWAWWRAERKNILRTAKEAGITAGDAIAEGIRERVELEPERAIDYLQQDADAWLEAEIRKVGFAA
jgi:hypothetical protein